MELYKVLLVDDEEDVRQSIVRKLDWAALGFVVVGEAGNGEEALELAELLQPDVIMTDIKMPFMDGLELCRQVKQLLTGVRLAIFSGFDEFEYAREAIAQQVEEYILKPIDADELSAVFRRIRGSLDAEIAQRRDVEMLRRHYEAALPLMRQQLISGLLEGRLELDLDSWMREYGLELAAEEYAVAVVRYELDNPAEDSGLLSVSLRRIIEDTLAPRPLYHLVQGPGRIVLLFLTPAGGAGELSAYLGQLFPLARRMLDIRLHIGIGNGYPRLDEIALSYQEAQDALEYQLLMEPGQCICIRDIEPGAMGGDPPDPRYAAQLLRQIKVGSKLQLREAVRGLIVHLRSLDTGVQQCQIYLLELFAQLLQLIRAYRMDPVAAGQESLLREGMTMHLTDLTELEQWLADYCNNLRLLARQERRNSAQLLIDRARELLAEQYRDSTLSQDSFCQQLSVSSAYFSTLFKKGTGQGFVSYLTALRMEKALELLLSTDYKTYEIAQLVGYTDPNYFSHVFKKQFGTSPSKYRTDRMERHEGQPDPP